ncbi:Hsp20/alpha crystallin family protein [Halococcus sp. AFM35]|uniref:Hsp20/alpha crystallin family protein n=1 Tax=Halococcus sp. AFM35 TaxID=3421653 RepID=UPI003EBE460F
MTSVGESLRNTVLDGVGRFAGRAQERRPLPTDLLESDDAYLVVFDAPDASAADVQVRFSDGSVHVRIDRSREHREGFEMRFPGRGLSLDGSVRLPAEATVDPDAATATLTAEGTLEVELPKVEGTEDGPIRISADEGSETDVIDERSDEDASGSK